MCYPLYQIRYNNHQNNFFFFLLGIIYYYIYTTYSNINNSTEVNVHQQKYKRRGIYLFQKEKRKRKETLIPVKFCLNSK